ncbi:hypothetical protein AB0C74_39610 [Spirillospora sp. NPDC048832]
MDVWGVVAVVAVLGAVVALPAAALGLLGGGRRGRGRRGGGIRIRVGPGLLGTLVIALVRRTDTVLLGAVSVAVVVLVVLNARA